MFAVDVPFFHGVAEMKLCAPGQLCFTFLGDTPCNINQMIPGDFRLEKSRKGKPQAALKQ